MSEPSLEALPVFLAGLAFFFLGLDRIRTSLRGIAGRSARRRAASTLASPVRAAALGFAFGAVTQSATAVAFIIAGLVSVGLVPVRRALSNVAWANPGTAVLAFLAAIDLSLATHWLVGIVGLALRSRRFGGSASLLGAVFGLGLLLYGLVQLRSAAGPIQSADWFAPVASLLAGPLPVAFALGALLRIAIQSSSGIAVILIVLCGRGVIDAEHAMMAIHGTGIGVGLTVVLLARQLRGEPLRVAWWQAVINGVAATVLAVWLLLAAATGIPSLTDILAGTGMAVETQLAVGFLLQMLLCPVVAVCIGARAPALLDRLAPTRAEEALVTPRYLSGTVIDQTELAVDLVGREQRRVLDAARSLLDPARTDVGAASGMDVRAVRSGLDALCTEIRHYLGEVLERASEPRASAAVVAATGRQQALGELIETLDAMAGEIATLPADTPARDLAGIFAETCDLLLATLTDLLRDGDATDRAIVLAMTEDRGEQIERLRARVASGELGAPEMQARVLYALGLFERATWLARRIAGSVGQETAASLSASPVAAGSATP
ncbi:MAG: Na/Pi symporter [Chloroflexota bacterium]